MQGPRRALRNPQIPGRCRRLRSAGHTDCLKSNGIAIAVVQPNSPVAAIVGGELKAREPSPLDGEDGTSGEFAPHDAIRRGLENDGFQEELRVGLELGLARSRRVQSPIDQSDRLPPWDRFDVEDGKPCARRDEIGGIRESNLLPAGIDDPEVGSSRAASRKYVVGEFELVPTRRCLDFPLVSKSRFSSFEGAREKESENDSRLQDGSRARTNRWMRYDTARSEAASATIEPTR